MEISTIGVKVGYGVETSAGVKPTAFTNLVGIKAFGEVSTTKDQIDITCLADKIKRYVAGLADTGGSWELTFGLDDSIITMLQTMITAYETAKTAGKNMWFTIWFPSLEKGYFLIAEPGEIPTPDGSVAAAAEIKISCTINEYKGLDEAVEPA